VVIAYWNDLTALYNRVIASASPEDDCWLYQLANFKKSGQLIEAFNTGGSKEVFILTYLKKSSSENPDTVYRVVHNIPLYVLRSSKNNSIFMKIKGYINCPVRPSAETLAHNFCRCVHIDDIFAASDPQATLSEQE
jgi:hypothetical protein